MCRIVSLPRSAKASSPSTSSPGSISTASRVTSQPTTKPFLKNGPTACVSIIILLLWYGRRSDQWTFSNDHSHSRRSHVHIQDQDGGQSARRGGHLRAIVGRGAGRNAKKRALARDLRPQQSPHRPARHGERDEERPRTVDHPDARVCLARADRRHRRGAKGRYRRGAGAVGVYDAARRDSPAPMTLIDVFRARRRIAPYIRRTPLISSAWLSELARGVVSLKLESLQLSNSFKSRGAFSAVSARLERGSAAPARLVTASAGNHGRALAAAAELFRLPLVVFTPVDAPHSKVAAIRRHGAELRAEGRDYDNAERLAKAFAAEAGAELISPDNDAERIAGAG